MLSKNGIPAIQLREKDLSAAELLKLAGKISSKIKKYNTKLIINDRADIAILSGSHGVHSPSLGISNKDIRKLSGNLISGKSVHSVKEAIEAEKNGFDYIMFGPVFRTPAKVKFGKPQGIKKLEMICSSVNIPVFAVGGITPVRVKKCISAGAYGVAAIREFMLAKDQVKVINEFKNQLPGN